MLTMMVEQIQNMIAVLLGWPLLIVVSFASLFCTVAYGFVQFRYFFASWAFALFPSSKDVQLGKAALSPLQAFINSLGMSLGNGALAGVATSICLGGPGALFWLVVTGLLLMAVRFAEVYLSMYYADVHARIGGPMLYLKRLYGGKYLSLSYALFVLLYGYIVGNAIQTNAISISLQRVLNLQPVVIALFFLVFMFYVVSGGAQRILRVSDAIVPIKVILFFVSCFIVVGYHWQSVWPALLIIYTSAFGLQAATGGVMGYLIQNAMRQGMLRILMASEAGLGTSGILFGSTSSKRIMEDSIMSMLTVFISVIVCFLIGLCIIVSGVWDCGLTSTALTIAAFQTVFGEFGGWLVTLLSMSFGLGLIVSYAFIAREMWLYLSSNRYEKFGSYLYCACSVIGTLCNVHVLWTIVDAINVCMLFLNLIGIIWLSSVVSKGIRSYENR